MMTIWFVMGAAALLALTYAGPQVGEAYIDDLGLVQLTTLAILIITGVTAAVFAVTHPENRLNLGLLSVCMAVYAGREYDLHRLEFLPEHFTRFRFYLLPDVSLSHKLSFGLLMIAIIGVIGTFLVRMLGPTLRDLKRAEPWAIIGVAWFTTLTISQISDRSWLNETFAGRAFEETAELIASGLALMVVCYFPKGSTTATASARELPRPAAHAKAA